MASNFERSGRFLDAPEFTVLHNRGTAVNVFDRIDYSPNSKDTFHLNLFLARNNFQTSNDFDHKLWVKKTKINRDAEHDLDEVRLAHSVVDLKRTLVLNYLAGY